MTRVHPSAVVEPDAKLADNVEIGPFCHVGAHVILAEGVKLHSHVVIAGDTEIGARTCIFPFASIGHAPQDLKYRGEPVSLRIGTDCIIREGVTINPGTVGGKGQTRIGDECVFLANAHVAHDCLLGRGVLLSNNVMLAGHCYIGDYAILSGGSAVHQFARVGAYAFLGGLTGVTEDLIPFGLAIGNRAHLAGLNIVGMKRHNFSHEHIHALRNAYKILFTDKGQGPLKDRIDDVAKTFVHNPAVQTLVTFLREGGDRAVLTPHEKNKAE